MLSKILSIALYFIFDIEACVIGLMWIPIFGDCFVSFDLAQVVVRPIPLILGGRGKINGSRIEYCHGNFKFSA